MDDISALESCNLIIINHATVDAARIRDWAARGIRVIDTTGVTGVERGLAGYEGIFW